jgi:hypothetical protein
VDCFISHGIGHKYEATGPTTRWAGQPTPLLLQELHEVCESLIEGVDFCYPFRKPYKTTPHEYHWYTPAEMVGMRRLAQRKIGCGNQEKWMAHTFYGDYVTPKQLSLRIRHLIPAARISTRERTDGYRRDIMTTMAAKLNPTRLGLYCWTCGKDHFDVSGYHFSHIKKKLFAISRAVTANWRDNKECTKELFERKAVIVECRGCHIRRGEKYEHRQYTNVRHK